MKSLVLDRITAAYNAHPTNIDRYIVHGSMGIEEVRCKCCGGRVRGLVPDDRFQEQRTINGRQVTCERLVLASFSGYTEVLIYFNDGSKHVTVLCSNCASKLTPDELELLYCRDLNEWILEGSDASDEFWAQQAARLPTGFKAFPSGQIAS